MGAAAAVAVAGHILKSLAERGRAVGLFASALSQRSTWDVLVREPGIDWKRVTAFHLDEYLGFDQTHPQSFRRYLLTNFLSLIPIGAFHALHGEAPDPSAECERYAHLLSLDPPDFALIGIGENGHLAFNDPHVADFNDPAVVKIVELDEPCRRQQVNDGAFSTLDEVPERALTVTVPVIMSVDNVFAVVPGSRKRAAIEAALHGPLTPACPASVLRTHPRCRLFLDAASALG